MPNSERPPRLYPDPSREPIREFNAHNSEGRENRVLITSERFISEGHFGVIYEVMARTIGAIPIPGNQPPFDTKRRAHEFPAIIKVFKNPADAERALLIHEASKKAGLRVLPTYRIDTGHGVAIMTELNSENKVTLSSNNWNLRSGEVRIHAIENWAEMLTAYFEEAEKAAEQGIELKNDVYFFQVPTDTQTPTLDFFAADYDTIEFPSTLSPEALRISNTQRLYDSAAIFLHKYVEPKQWAKHNDILKKMVKKLLPPKSKTRQK